MVVTYDHNFCQILFISTFEHSFIKAFNEKAEYRAQGWLSLSPQVKRSPLTCTWPWPGKQELELGSSGNSTGHFAFICNISHEIYSFIALGTILNPLFHWITQNQRPIWVICRKWLVVTDGMSRLKSTGDGIKIWGTLILRVSSFLASILKYQPQSTSAHFNLFQSTSTILTKFNLSHKKVSTHTSTYFNPPQLTSTYFTILSTQFAHEKNMPSIYTFAM